MCIILMMTRDEGFRKKIRWYYVLSNDVRLTKRTF